MKSIKIFSILFVSLIAFRLHGQQADHYIINLSDRQIKGEIRLSTPALNSSMINFREEGTSEFKRYNPNQIKAWSVNELVYESKALILNDEEGYTFFMCRKTPKKGRVHLYDFYNPMSSVGFLQTFLEKDRQLTEVDYGKFRKQMTEFFSDYTELSEKIANKHYKKKDLLMIIKEYNAWRESLWN